MKRIELENIVEIHTKKLDNKEEVMLKFTLDPSLSLEEWEEILKSKKVILEYEENED